MDRRIRKKKVLTRRKTLQTPTKDHLKRSSHTRSSLQVGGRRKQPPLGQRRDALQEASLSDSDPSSSDEAYPHEPIAQLNNAFSDKLSLFSPQKRIPKRVNKQQVIDTVFSALFERRRSRRRSLHSNPNYTDDSESNTGTETDEPNEEFVKKGLHQALFKDNSPLMSLTNSSTTASDRDALDQYINSSLINELVTAMRFEDFRTSSARLDIVRAIHKSCPNRRLDIAKALADAIALRYQYIQSLLSVKYDYRLEAADRTDQETHDHGHVFLELLRYIVEHVGESLNGFARNPDEAPLSGETIHQILLNYTRSLILLAKTHSIDPAGTDEDELLDCAGQFVSYIPRASLLIVSKFLSAWSKERSSQELLFLKILSRILMSGPKLDLLDPSSRLHYRVFQKLSECIRSPHVQIARDAMNFCRSPLVLNHYVAFHPFIYEAISNALNFNAQKHWNAIIRSTADGDFDLILDFAP